MADYSAEIAQLKTLINAGVDTVTTDGQTTRFDIDAARKRLAELEAATDGATFSRPKHATIDLRNAGP